MNRPSTDEIKHALRYAHHNITAHNHKYICNALPGSHAGEYLRWYIQKQLGGSFYSTVGSWVYKNVMKGEEYPSDEDLRAYRLRWIEWMMDQ